MTSKHRGLKRPQGLCSVAPRHPAMIDYGIFGIPAIMLVGKDGKIVSTQARGAELARLLEELLGSKEEATPDPPTAGNAV